MTPPNTYFADRGTVSLCIYFFLLSEFLSPLEFCTVPVLFSDHVLVLCKVDTKVRVRFGDGLWKLNHTMLDDEEVCKKSEDLFETLVVRKGEYANILEWWDWMKVQVACFFKRISVQTARERRERENLLIRRIHFLHQCRRMGLQVDEELEEVRVARIQLLEDKGKGIIFKAKIQDMEEGERCSRFFFKKIPSTKKIMSLVWLRDVEVGCG